jgi:hypothetical protein
MTIRADIPQTHHIGFVARDCYAMARSYEKLLGAKFDLLPPLPVHDLYDQPATIRVAYGAFAGLVVEIIEPMDGDLPHQRFLDKYGEGIQHIGFLVPDPQKASADLVAMGAEFEWIVDDTNHTSIGYLKPTSTNEEMVKRITPDCLTYMDVHIGNVAIEFMGPQIQGRMLTRWDGKLGDDKQSQWTESGDGRVASSHPLLGELIVSRPDNWFKGE